MQTTAKAFLFMAHKKELKTQCNFEILMVVQIQDYDFDVYNLTANAKEREKHTNVEHLYSVSWDDKAGTLGCTCMFGTNEISGQIYDEYRRCKHIQAVREFLNFKNETDREQMERIKQATKESTQAMIKKGYLND